MKNKVKFICESCGTNFWKYKSFVEYFSKNNIEKKFSCCSRKCVNILKAKKKLKNCKVCNTQFSYKHKTQIFCSNKCSNHTRKNPFIKKRCKLCDLEFIRKGSKVNQIFCSKKCSITFTNSHRKGNNRSKLEVWIESQLKSKYSDLEIHFNRRDAINAELDIYIPSMKLAFELNGVFHYEPIFGSDQLKLVKNNDERKLQACFEKQIELCIIDTHNVKYLKKERDIKFLEIIISIIERKRSMHY